MPCSVKALISRSLSNSRTNSSRPDITARRKPIPAPPIAPHAMPIPTVDSLLASTAIGNGWHDWPIEGGSIRVETAALRIALGRAYDPFMPNWASFIDEDDIEDAQMIAASRVMHSYNVRISSCGSDTTHVVNARTMVGAYVEALRERFGTAITGWLPDGGRSGYPTEAAPAGSGAEIATAGQRCTIDAEKLDDA